MIPTPVTVLVRDYVEGAEDAHGNTTVGYSAARDWRVHGVAPGASEEPRKPNRDLSVVEWTIYAPADSPAAGGKPANVAPGEHGQASLPWEDVAGEPQWYDVEGRPDDWTRGPWPMPIAGVVVQLRKAAG